LAGLEPAAVIVEILNEDGTMARRPDLEVFAQEFGLKIGTIADLIDYRLRKERNLERVAHCKMKNHIGEFQLIAYRDLINNLVHFALVKGDINEKEPTMVRVHMPHYLNDVLGMTAQDSTWPLESAMRRIEQEGKGVVIMLNKQDAQEDVVAQIKECQMKDKGKPVYKPEASPDLRTYGIGAQILLDLGVRKMRVLSSPKRMHGLSGFGLEVAEYVTE